MKARTTEERDTERLAILKKHVAELAEHYDAVQIVATWLASDNLTRSHKCGSGNWYARTGLCREFINENLADDQAEAIARKLDPPDDGWKEASPA